jgi:hypothetical protein
MLTLDELKKLCADSQIYDLCAPVLEDPRLQTWPLNCTDDRYHSYPGGLLLHLCEVISSGILLCNLYFVYFKVDLNVKEFLIGAVWMYYGKFFVMQPTNTDTWTVDTLRSAQAISVSEFSRHFCHLQAESAESLEALHGVSYEKIITLISGVDSISTESTLLKTTTTLSQTLHT